MNFEESKDVYSVTSLTRELKNLVEGKYRFVKVEGEISNLRKPFSGHAYFTLKDDGAQIKGVLFKGQARYLEKSIQDGQQVICHGRISIYEARGDYQLIVDSVDFHGSGLLQLQFEKLKRQLQEEGLFTKENKQNCPAFPKEIVLLTSPSGAAVHDFLKIWRKKNFPTSIKIYAVPVQGQEAAHEIAKGIAIINELLPETDIIVLCRGGGSLEDLWPFNEEILARAISHSKMPIVSAVGHEVDFTISDFCADLRAPTPTAAAEMLIPDGRELAEQTERYQRSLGRILLGKIEDYQYRIAQNRRILGDMGFLFTNATLRLDHASLKLCNLIEKRISHSMALNSGLSARLHNNSPTAKVHNQEQRLQFATDKLTYLCKNLLSDKESMLNQQAALLDAVSPLATMARGYSITSKIDPKSGRRSLVTESGQLKIDDRVEVRLHRGKVACEVVQLMEE